MVPKSFAHILMHPQTCEQVILGLRGLRVKAAAGMGCCVYIARSAMGGPHHQAPPQVLLTEPTLPTL